MCRFLVYKGVPMRMGLLLTEPSHSIIKQSYDSRERMVNEEVPANLNADGFGVGWYMDEEDEEEAAPHASRGAAAHVLGDGHGTPASQELSLSAGTPHSDPNVRWLRRITYRYDDTPCVFKSITPAWNNRNLRNLAEKTSSHLMFAHVRAATPGLAVNSACCHPFTYKQYTSRAFRKIKRRMAAAVSDEAFHNIQGSTDSEHAFALFLSQIDDFSRVLSPRELRQCIVRTTQLISAWALEAGVRSRHILNFAVTDGNTVIVSRWTSWAGVEGASLYYASGTSFECVHERHRIVRADRKEHLVMVASEPLSDERADWVAVPTNHTVTITPDLAVLIDAMDVPTHPPPQE